jgi:hypothetical protein
MPVSAKALFSAEAQLPLAAPGNAAGGFLFSLFFFAGPPIGKALCFRAQ